MHSIIISLTLAVGLGAAVSAAAKSPPTPAPAPPDFLARIDASTVVVVTGKGHQTPLFRGLTGDVVWDSVRELLWHTPKGGTLEVIDPRKTPAKAVELVTGLSTHWQVRHAAGTIGSTDDYHLSKGVIADLRWTKTPSVLAARGWYGEPEAVEAYDKVLKLTPKGRRWLTRNVGRPSHKAHSRRQPKELPISATVRALVDEPEDCRAQDSCGWAAPFGRSGWFIVVTNVAAVEDWTYTYALFDPATKRFAHLADYETHNAPQWRKYEALGDEATTELPIALDPTQRWFFIAGKRCTFSHCVAMKGTPLGFLKGEWVIDGL